MSSARLSSPVRALLALLLVPGCYVTVNADKETADTGANFDKNTPPTCEIVSPVEGQVLPANQFVTLQASVFDAETDPEGLEVTWESNQVEDLGISSPDADGTAVLTTDLLGPGLHLITLTVLDPGGNPCVDQVTVDLQSAPVVSILGPAEGSIIDQGAVTLTGTVTDAEQAPNLLSVSWTDDVAGVIDSTPADGLGAATFTTEVLALGLHTVTLAATDASGLTGSASVTFTVNGVPTAPAISLTPVDPDTNADLVVTVDVASTDPDGSPVSYVYEWLRDGVADLAYTADTLPADATTRGEVWTVNVAGTDGVTTGPIATASAVIANSAPVIALVVTPLVLDTIDTDTVIHAEATVEDGDGDAVTVVYQWFVDGYLLFEDGTDLDGELWFDKGDLVELVVTADDGLTIAQAAWSVTVANTPPYAGLISLAPGFPTDGEDLLCGILVESVDPDDDVVTYDFAWDVNGVPFSDALTDTTVLPTDTVAAFHTFPGEFWTCTVTPNDGTANGVARQLTVLVQ